MILLMFLYYPCGSFWNLLQVLFEGMRAQSKHTLFREERKCCLPCSLKALHLWDITSGLQWHFWNWNHTDGSLEDYYCQAWLLPFCVCLLKSLALDTVASIRLWEKKEYIWLKHFVGFTMFHEFLTDRNIPLALIVYNFNIIQALFSLYCFTGALRGPVKSFSEI